MKQTTNKPNISLPVGILIGAVIGGVAGVLLAPASGKENRKKLREITEKMRMDLEKRLSEAKTMTEDSYNKVVTTLVDEYSKKEPLVKEKAEQIKETLKGRFDHSKDED